MNHKNGLFTILFYQQNTKERNVNTEHTQFITTCYKNVGHFKICYGFVMTAWQECWNETSCTSFVTSVVRIFSELEWVIQSAMWKKLRLNKVFYILYHYGQISLLGYISWSGRWTVHIQSYYPTCKIDISWYLFHMKETKRSSKQRENSYVSFSDTPL